MSPRKVQAIAGTEFFHLVQTRVFQLSLVLVPLFTLGLSLLLKRFDPAAAAGPDPRAAAALVPVGSMALVFLMVMLTTPQMMSSVIEEKMSRISEVLLASVGPFDLMLGKLLACCAAAGLVGILYLGLGLALAAHWGYGALFTPSLLFSFVFFLGLAVFLHGSVYMAVGAACTEPKDAQGLLAPLVLLASMPLILLRALIAAPQGGLASALSLFPLSAPFVMCFRVQSRPGPPLQELCLSVGITVLGTLFCVWAASRIFRVGLLAQGKAPHLSQLWRWIFID